MSLITLQLDSEFFSDTTLPARQLHLPSLALLALLAANVFVISGVLCFGLLYFYF